MLRGWKDVPVRDLIAAASGLPTVVENDATCAVFGEAAIGAGRGRSVVAGFTLGTGIGGGLVVDGRPFRGATGMAGEFGHVAVADAPDCPCGSRGCLHMLASASATVDRYESMTGDRGVDDVAAVIGKAAAGDSQAMAVLDVTLDYLSRGVRAVINVLNPDLVVLCGGMAQCGVPLEDRVRSRLEGTVFRSASQTAIRSALLGLHSGAVGAALLAAQEA
jgi:predicted NBD/HSP70 family sugar kinase